MVKPQFSLYLDVSAPTRMSTFSLGICVCKYTHHPDIYYLPLSCIHKFPLIVGESSAPARPTAIQIFDVSRRVLILNAIVLAPHYSKFSSFPLFGVSPSRFKMWNLKQTSSYVKQEYGQYRRDRPILSSRPKN